MKMVQQVCEHAEALWLQRDIQQTTKACVVLHSGQFTVTFKSGSSKRAIKGTFFVTLLQWIPDPVG